MKNYTNLKRLCTWLLFLTAAMSFAQTKVSGTVNDQKGMPIPGVNVVLEGTTKGAVTDFDGKFSIDNVEDGTYTLKASSIGYANYTQSITAAGSDVVLKITLAEDTESLDQVIITGVVNPRSKIESSISVTSMQPATIKQSAPRTTAEIFRTIPGIRSESSGGEGNANIAVRGVPISSGGSKYVQLQEDGLPVLLFGDIAFGTADIFTRFDYNVKRIEAIRGGSASTLTSNGPGGIINIISKTGKNEGGAIGTTFGVDFNSFRTDFDYGSKIGDGLYFHTGGFYRAGEGIRETGFTANNGGQLKLSLTKEFESGSVRVYAKYLNDRAAAYLPMPIQVTGTNSDPDWSDAPNFDATRGSLHSANLTQTLGLGADGQRRRGDVTNGMNPISTSVGIQANFNLGDDWKVSNNGRFSSNRGAFVSPFPAEVASASAIADSFGTGSTLQFTDGSAVAGSSLVARVHMFDVELDNFNNFMNDLKLSKSFDNVDVTVGYFKSIQDISMSWLWNSYLQEVNDDNARLINVFDATGGALSENGLYAYGVPFWGNCCQRNYDTQYNVSAPYMNVTLEANENFTIDASLRYDKGRVSGSFTNSVQTVFDVNNDGVISAPEQSVSTIDNANPTAVDYDYDYVSYSLGLNYKLNDAQAIFGRYSRGASAKADRILFSGLDYLNGDRINALDFINQAEIGYKRGFENGAIYATAFYAKTEEEGGFEASTNSIIENDYKSLGIEVEGFYRFNDFSLRGAVTWTDAEVDSGVNEGNTPRRQPDFIYNLIPAYDFGKERQNSVGLSFIGQSKAYAQDNNELVMPGFLIVNSFINVGITKSLNVNLAANNIFDSLGITESEEGSIVEGQTNIVRARPLPGRSISLTLQYQF
ncbi:outer membrane receptor protein involved in Fe transport [Kordia periserrulae]|uniref:Outer membrane receptor protein involved in Fe transport n=1 Tax=Kordia periserrulae TaxID=701523 RepID=A0A2T6C1R1_9FLAO|nr:TonB-dependent receptor [Kordia periserrulae]PTX62262.1 outer membrane receptor protein involved in Fe transport [Kordia periserrulae]